MVRIDMQNKRSNPRDYSSGDEVQVLRRNFSQKHGRKKKWQRVLSVLAAITVFTTTYALILPALTLEKTYCGMEEHTHVEACYQGEETPTCGKEEHAHGLACYSDPNADLETPERWESSVSQVQLTGEWGNDVVAIANSQIGYKESTENYQVAEDGVTTKGYTRYGAWYQDPYANWDAMFVSFCLNYAQVSWDSMPFDSDTYSWMCSLNKANRYHPASEVSTAAQESVEVIKEPTIQAAFTTQAAEGAEGAAQAAEGAAQAAEGAEGAAQAAVEGTEGTESAQAIQVAEGAQATPAVEAAQATPTPAPYTPARGDLVFFDTNKDGLADRMGIVAELVKQKEDTAPLQIKTIEGDSSDTVEMRMYDISDASIIGYAALPQNPEGLAAEEGSQADGQSGNAHNDNASNEGTDPTNATSEEGAENATSEEGDTPTNTNSPEVGPTLSKEQIAAKNEEALKTSLTVTTDNFVDVVMTIPSGAFDVPLNELTLVAEAIDNEEAQQLINEAAGAQDGENTKRTTQLFDIRVMHGDTELQPQKPVQVKFTGVEAPKDDVQVFHVNTEEKVAENMNATAVAENAVEIDAEHFSIYGLTYTVDFHLGDYDFSIGGEDRIYLSDLFTKIGIDKNIADVQTVEFSNPSLVTVEPAQHNNHSDWLLTPQQPFSTDETLTITFTDGEVIVVRVTDAVQAATFAALKAAIESGAPEVELTASFAMTGTITVPTGRSVKLTSPTDETLSRGFNGTFFNVPVGATFEISGLTCTGGTYTGGAGSFITVGGTAILNANFSGDNGNGAPIYASGSDAHVTIEGGVISGNHFDQAGAMKLTQGADAEMTGGTMSNNSAPNGGAVHMGTPVADSEPCVFDMSGGTMTNNVAATCGGAVYVGNCSEFNLSGDAILSSNKAMYGGAVYVNGIGPNGEGFDDTGVDKIDTHNKRIEQRKRFKAAINMRGGAILNNTAGGNGVGGGGGIGLDSDYANLVYGRISGNSAGSMGGGVYQGDRFKMTFHQNPAEIHSIYITNNTAANNGGGIWCCSTGGFRGGANGNSYLVMMNNSTAQPLGGNDLYKSASESNGGLGYFDVPYSLGHGERNGYMMNVPTYAPDGFTIINWSNATGAPTTPKQLAWYGGTAALTAQSARTVGEMQQLDPYGPFLEISNNYSENVGGGLQTNGGYEFSVSYHPVDNAKITKSAEVMDDETPWHEASGSLQNYEKVDPDKNAKIRYTIKVNIDPNDLNGARYVIGTVTDQIPQYLTPVMDPLTYTDGMEMSVYAGRATVSWNNVRLYAGDNEFHFVVSVDAAKKYQMRQFVNSATFTLQGGGGGESNFTYHYLGNAHPLTVYKKFVGWATNEDPLNVLYGIPGPLTENLYTEFTLKVYDENGVQVIYDMDDLPLGTNMSSDGTMTFSLRHLERWYLAAVPDGGRIEIQETNTFSHNYAVTPLINDVVFDMKSGTTSKVEQKGDLSAGSTTSASSINIEGATSIDVYNCKTASVSISKIVESADPEDKNKTYRFRVKCQTEVPLVGKGVMLDNPREYVYWDANNELEFELTPAQRSNVRLYMPAGSKIFIDEIDSGGLTTWIEYEDVGTSYSHKTVMGSHFEHILKANMRVEFHNADSENAKTTFSFSKVFQTGSDPGAGPYVFTFNFTDSKGNPISLAGVTVTSGQDTTVNVAGSTVTATMEKASNGSSLSFFLKGVPYGAVVHAREIQSGGYSYVTFSGSDQTISVPVGKTVELYIDSYDSCSFTATNRNTVETRSFTIRKRGNSALSGQDFNFTVKVTDQFGNPISLPTGTFLADDPLDPTNTYTVSAGGIITGKTQIGGSLVLKNIPYGALVNVTEEPVKGTIVTMSDSTYGDVSFTNSKTYSSDQVRDVTVTNYRNLDQTFLVNKHVFGIPSDSAKGTFRFEVDFTDPNGNRFIPDQSQFKVSNYGTPLQNLVAYDEDPVNKKISLTIGWNQTLGKYWNYFGWTSFVPGTVIHIKEVETTATDQTGKKVDFITNWYEYDSSIQLYPDQGVLKASGSEVWVKLGQQYNGRTYEIECVNTRSEEIEVTKEVVGATNSKKAFPFELAFAEDAPNGGTYLRTKFGLPQGGNYLLGGTNNDSSYIFSLRDGESIKLKLPYYSERMKFMLNENVPNNYVASSELTFNEADGTPVTITGADTLSFVDFCRLQHAGEERTNWQAKFTNTPQAAEINITKTVEGFVPAGKRFPMKVEIKDADGNLWSGQDWDNYKVDVNCDPAALVHKNADHLLVEMTYVQGANTVVIGGIPEGYKAVVTELDYVGFTPNYRINGGNAGAWEPGNVAETEALPKGGTDIEFNNVSASTTLTINKVVQGGDDDPQAPPKPPYEFEVTFKDGSGNYLQIADDNNVPRLYEVADKANNYKVTFQLNDGESIVLKEVPLGAVAYVTEKGGDYNIQIDDITPTTGRKTLAKVKAGADATTDDPANLLVIDEARTLEVINNYGVGLPMTGGAGTLLYALGGTAIMATALVFGLRARRKRLKGGY